jgi:hypothetical protein
MTFSLPVVKIGHVVQTLEQRKLNILEKHVLIFCVLSWQFITLVTANSDYSAFKDQQMGKYISTYTTKLKRARL